MTAAELARTRRRIARLERADGSRARVEVPNFRGTWLGDRFDDVQSLILDLADRVTARCGTSISREWWFSNKDWADSIPFAVLIRFFLRDRLIRAPDGKTMIPPPTTADRLIHLLFAWMKCGDAKAGFDVGWQHLNFLPPVQSSQALVDRIWPGAVLPRWVDRLHPSAVPLPSGCVVEGPNDPSSEHDSMQ